MRRKRLCAGVRRVPVGRFRCMRERARKKMSFRFFPLNAECDIERHTNENRPENLWLKYLFGDHSKPNNWFDVSFKRRFQIDPAHITRPANDKTYQQIVTTVKNYFRFFSP